MPTSRTARELVQVVSRCHIRVACLFFVPAAEEPRLRRLLWPSGHLKSKAQAVYRERRDDRPYLCEFHLTPGEEERPLLLDLEPQRATQQRPGPIVGIAKTPLEAKIGRAHV